MSGASAAVVCPEAAAANAGGEVLAAGGNAVDAAICAAFVQGVVNPLMCGIGGTGRMLVYEASTRQPTLVNFGTRAGSKARPDTYSAVEPSIFSNRFRARNWENYIGHKAVAIPSFVRGVWDAHLRFGSLPWDRLLEPAIELAANGFIVDEFIYRFWDPGRDQNSDSPPPLTKLTATEECARIYLKGGEVYLVGERLVQTDYAETLRRIAAEGADVFYTGEIARTIAADFKGHGGLFTLEDLGDCATDFEEPVRGVYKGLEVATEGSPSMGSLEISALHMLERIDLSSLGWRSAKYYHVLARVFQAMYGDRTRYNADPHFVDVPEHLFLSRERAARLAAQLATDAPISAVLGASDADETTHVSVVDGCGNAAAVTHSNGNSAGVVTPGLGFLYNHHMHNFDPRPGQLNSIAPGKRPLFGCSPLMLLDGDRLRLVSGSKSRYRVTAEIQVLVDMFEFGADLEEAISNYRIHAEYAPDTVYVEPEVPTALSQSLSEMGWRCQVVDMAVPMCTVLRTAEGAVRAVADARGGDGLWLA